MAKREQRGNREAKKPKKEKIKTIAAAPSQKTATWQPTIGSGKRNSRRRRRALDRAIAEATPGQRRGDC